MGFLKSLSIRGKLYCAIAILVFSFAGVAAIGIFGMWFLSGVRAYVGGESLLAKAQKNAVYSLSEYALFRDEADYKKFERDIKIPLGDRKARLELQKRNPNLGAAYDGFVEGGNRPDDIEGMILIFLYFQRLSYFKRAVMFWREGDDDVARLQKIAAQLHQSISSHQGSPPNIRPYLEKISRINDALTALESNFSFTLGEASRWLKRTLFWAMIAFLALIGLPSIYISLSIGEEIASGIREASIAAAKVAAGDLSARLPFAGNDELGRLAADFNHMAESLAQMEREMKSFSYSVAHDLRAPLRAIEGFSHFLIEDYSDRLGEQGKDYLNRIGLGCQRMGQLIDDLLALANVTRQEMKSEKTDLREIAKSVMEKIEEAEPNRRVEFSVPARIEAFGDPGLLKIVLENLIGNAWKFTSKTENARIEIGSTQKDGETAYFVKDNGAGFDMKYVDKIFDPFQRLHSQSDFPGQGLGLAIVSRIVHRHGGRIWAEGEVGKGAALYFTLGGVERGGLNGNQRRNDTSSGG